MIYFDHAASTPLHPLALKQYCESLATDFANPSSAHRLGRSLNKRVEEVRHLFLETVAAREVDYDFIFTASATEANNTIVRWIVGGSEGKNDGRIYYSCGDHPSITESIARWGGSNNGRCVEGGGKLDDLLDDLLDGLRAVFLIQVNNSSGVISDVEKIASKIKNFCPDIYVHVDAAQSFCKIPLSLRKAEIDSVTISAQKCGGPKGVAGLYLKKKRVSTFSPLLVGGGQEHALRASTVNAPAIFAWGAAVSALGSVSELEQNYRYVTRLNDLLRAQLSAKVPVVQFPFYSCSPYILLIIAPKVASDILVRHLEEREIYVASSAACSSRVKGENKTFSAMGIANSLHKHVLRLSFSPSNTEAEILEFVKNFADIYHQLLEFT
ncbi:MAG: aminotransferase class V-fold PLP-dependent enzyme [Oligoflexia bacterium]|nr:aminotransferase class V-fold PLP-dependent enzyme [Oligoflexia bacterium]